ncbi:hypothetical protein ACTFIY_012373 [Dictyostelium cf. discoideum]
MNLPHFIRSCKIDPDFSVLLSTNFKSSCPSDNDGDKKSWLIPVAVTVPVVACSVLAGLSISPFLKKMKKLSKQ